MGGAAAYDAAPRFTSVCVNSEPPSNPPRLLVPLLCIALGALLRFAWPLDFEWKYDEQWMFDKALRIARGEDAWPLVGMTSGAGVQNPGASIWPFGVLAHVARTPLAMTVAIIALNVLALAGFTLWVVRAWNPRDRAIGVWGVALFAVSPLPVLFARKIWAQDVLPVLLVPFLWAHTFRQRPLAAFSWGLFGALLGQIHMSGFFAAAALALATLVLDRKGTHWLAWLAGSAIGALLLVPWVTFLLSGESNRASGYTVSLRFFYDAFMTAWGLHLRYSLGKNFGAYLRSPEVFGASSWLIGIAHIALGLLAIATAVVLLRKFRLLQMSRELRIHTLAIGLAGILLHLGGITIHPHYMIVFSPMLHVLAAWALSQSPRFLGAAVGLQAFVTATFLWFIHVQGGAPRGDYGVTYRAQTADQRPSSGTE